MYDTIDFNSFTADGNNLKVYADTVKPIKNIEEVAKFQRIFVLKLDASKLISSAIPSRRGCSVNIHSTGNPKYIKNTVPIKAGKTIS